MVIAICDFHLLVEAAFYHGGFVSETPKFLLGGLRRNDTRKIECRSLIDLITRSSSAEKREKILKLRGTISKVKGG
jgi:hypothetical protein